MSQKFGCVARLSIGSLKVGCVARLSIGISLQVAEARVVWHRHLHSFAADIVDEASPSRARAMAQLTETVKSEWILLAAYKAEYRYRNLAAYEAEYRYRELAAYSRLSVGTSAEYPSSWRAAVDHWEVDVVPECLNACDSEYVRFFRCVSWLSIGRKKLAAYPG